MSLSKTQGAFKYFIILPPAIYLFVLFIIPVSILWGYSFGERDGISGINITWTLENYEKVFSPLYMGILLKSMLYAGIATFICFIFGFFIALGIRFMPTKRLEIIMLIIIMLPFAMNMLVRVYSLMVILRRKGLVNSVYTWSMKKIDGFVEVMTLGTIDLFEGRIAPLRLLYNAEDLIFGLVYVYLPFMVLPLYAGMKNIDKSYFEASYDLGAGHLGTMISVVMPMLKPAIVTGLILTFIPMLGQYLIPDLMGGRDSVMIANVIAGQFKAANDWAFGSALSFILIYMTLIAVVVKITFGSNRD